MKVTPAVDHSWTEALGGLQILSHMFREGAEGRWFSWHALIWPGRVVVLRHGPGCGTVSLETRPQRILHLAPFTHAAYESNVPETVESLSSSHLSEVNAGDKIIGTLFTANRGHLDQPIINCASF